MPDGWAETLEKERLSVFPVTSPCGHVRVTPSSRVGPAEKPPLFPFPLGRSSALGRTLWESSFHVADSCAWVLFQGLSQAWGPSEGLVYCPFFQEAGRGVGSMDSLWCNRA